MQLASKNPVRAVFLALALAACGGDDKDNDKPEPEPKPDAGNAADAGKVESITCGADSCTAPQLNLGGIPLPSGAGGFSADVCCAGADEDLCGVSSALIGGGRCVEQDQKGEADPTCGGFMLNVAGFGLPISGCCKPSGECGLQLDLIGVGCMERSEASKLAVMASGIFGGAGADAGLTELPPVSCVFGPNPGPDGGEPDAGEPDASSADDAGASDAGPDAS